MTPPIPLPDFAARQICLIETEMEAESAETGLLLSQSSPATLQRAGLAITNLLVMSQRTGMGGRLVVEVSRDPATAVSIPGGGSRSYSGNGTTGNDLPEHSLRTGDIVAIQEQPSATAKKKEKQELKTTGVDGVVMKVTPTSISIACQKDDAEIPVGRLWIVKLANEVTYRRMKQLMGRLKTMADREQTPLMRVLLGLSKPQIPTESDIAKFQDLSWVLPHLNDSQKDAIRFALAAPDIALIHGPPGTGKTFTLVELILQILKQNPVAKVLVCGPSNISVDNIVERLNPHNVPLVRLGHPARLLPAVVDHSLDVLTRTSNAGEIVKDVRRELDEKQRSIRKAKNGRERRGIYTELKELRSEYRVRERKCVSDLLAGSRVVLSTLHGAGGDHLRHVNFDVVIVDEASQALEAQTWLAVMAGPKLILAGDHLQLPPTVKSMNSGRSKSRAPTIKKTVSGTDTSSVADTAVTSTATDSPASSMKLEVSLFDRMLERYGREVKRMLTVQYRMHETIMRYPSDTLYDGNLTAAEAVKSRLLRTIDTYPEEVDETEDTSEPIVFFDTQGGLFPETEEHETGKDEDNGDSSRSGKASTVSSLLSESKLNEMEGILAVMHAKSLVLAGVAEADIAVISPYNAQVGYISRLLKPVHPGIEIGSVDGFQGREKEAVIVSLVRSNDDGDVGFLRERRRLNVAMTRPKRHLCVIGDSETVAKGSAFLKGWMDFLTNNSDLRFPDPSDLERSP